MLRRQKRRVLPRLFIAIIVPIISLCATFILLYIFTPHPARSPTITRKVMPSFTHDVTTIVIAPPVQLSIKSINIVAVINPVGLTSSGDMDIDENPTELAWYKLGPKPGEEGSAVIAGHYGWKDGVPSVFNDLNKLVKGDIVSTLGDDGKTKDFVVNHTSLYTPNQDATYIFKSDDGKAHLNLITCQGSWNNSAQTYTKRLVVFADLAK